MKNLLPAFLKATACSNGVGDGVLCGGGTGTSPLLSPAGTVPFAGVPICGGEGANAGGEDTVCGGDWEPLWDAALKDCVRTGGGWGEDDIDDGGCTWGCGSFCCAAGVDGLAAPDVTTSGVSRSVSMELRLDMLESRERRFRSSGGRFRGWVLGSIFRRREDEDDGEAAGSDPRSSPPVDG